MLSHGQTRWCSIEEAINRILKRWDCLYKYFTEIQTDDSQEFIQDMNNYETKVYLCFLSLFLGKINSLNLKFQKNISEVSDINSDIQEFYSSIINILLKYEERNMSFEKKLCLITKKKGFKIDAHGPRRYKKL